MPSHGLRYAMRSLISNDDGPKPVGPQKAKKNQMAPRAHPRSPIKRGVPSSPQRFSKTLGSWKNRARAREAKELDDRHDRSSTDGERVTVNQNRQASFVDEPLLKPNRKRGRLEVTPNNLCSNNFFSAVAIERQRHPQWLFWAETTEGLGTFGKFTTCVY